MRLYIVFLVGIVALSLGKCGHVHEFDEEKDVNEWVDDDSGNDSDSDQHDDPPEPDTSDETTENFPDDMLQPRSLQNGPIRALYSKPSIVNLNKGIDLALEGARLAFTKGGQMSLPLKAVHKPFKGFIKGEFSASGGFFKNPASLHRTGDVILAHLDHTISLEVALGLQVAEAGYTRYDLVMMNIHQQGNISAQIAHNSLKMKMTFTYKPNCTLHLDYVMFDQLSGIKLNITGLGNFQSLFDVLSNWLIDNFQGELKGVVNKVLYQKLEEQLVKHDLCKYIPTWI